MQLGRAALVGSATLILGIAPLVAAHGGGETHNGMEGMNMEAAAKSAASAAAAEPVDPSYFINKEFQGWLYMHILSMVIAWVIVLPVGK